VTLFGFGAVGVVGILSMVLGAIIMVIYNVKAPAYFKGETLDKRVWTTD
jgi:membrane-bound ClpP family serine protease